MSLFVAPPDGAERQIRLQWRSDAQGSIIEALHEHVVPDDAAPGMTCLMLTRDSVCLADDIEAPHAGFIEVRADADAATVAAAIIADGYAAWVGWTATWSLAMGEDQVVFGYRRGLRFVAWAAGSRAVRAGDVDAVHVFYHAQIDRDAVVEHLASGRRGRPSPA